MRTEKELLEILLNNLIHMTHGLCALIEYLRFEGIINNQERESLQYYLRNNKPDDAGRLWWYVPGEIAPRLKWIKQQIEKLS